LIIYSYGEFLLFLVQEIEIKVRNKFDNLEAELAANMQTVMKSAVICEMLEAVLAAACFTGRCATCVMLSGTPKARTGY
jgi:hypothetical protein